MAGIDAIDPRGALARTLQKWAILASKLPECGECRIKSD